MAKLITQISDRIVSVSRRRFLSGTAGAIATTGAVLLPQQAIAEEPLTLEQMAHALHEAVGRHSIRKAPFDFEGDVSTQSRMGALGYAMENLRNSSIDEIQCILKPLFGG